MWTSLFLLSFLLSIAALVGLIIGLIKPRWVKLNKRGQSAAVFVSLFIVGLIGTVLTAYQVPQPENRIESPVPPSQETETSAAGSAQEELGESEDKALDLVAIGGSIDAFREQYGEEKSVVEETDSLVIGANFGPIQATFIDGICLSVSETTGDLDLTQDEALTTVEQFLPSDSQVVSPLYKGVFRAENLRDVESYTLVQTYFSEALAEITPEDDFEGWPAGSIQVSLIQDTYTPSRIVLWQISTDQPQYEPEE